MKRFRPPLLAMVMLVIALADSSEAQVRQWADNTGKYHVEAEYVELKDGKVHLKKADGKTVALPLARLSVADQEHIKQITAKARPPVAPPKPDAPAKETATILPPLPAKPSWQKNDEDTLKKAVVGFAADAVSAYIACSHVCEGAAKLRGMSFTVSNADGTGVGMFFPGSYVESGTSFPVDLLFSVPEGISLQ